jgi:copper chaperone CopZ
VGKYPIVYAVIMTRYMIIGLALFALASQAHAAGQTAILHIENMMCGADPHIVKDSLTKLKGVDSVIIALDAKKVIVSFDNAQVSVADLMVASGVAGYPATVSN